MQMRAGDEIGLRVVRVEEDRAAQGSLVLEDNAAPFCIEGG